MDTQKETAITIHKHNREPMKFLESQNGLYYYDTKPTNNSSTAYSFVNSVATNQSHYTNRQLASADQAKHIYELVGRPSHTTFLKIIRENQLKNCPISVDAKRSLKFYGPNVTALQGKTTRCTADHVPSNQLCPLPHSLLDPHRRVTLCCDNFFVDGFAFFATVSWSLHCITVEHITNRAIQTHILPCFKQVCNLYRARGFQVTMVHAYKEFPSLRDPLLALDNIHLNIAATNEHVP
jgi:hypothetical protein